MSGLESITVLSVQQPWADDIFFHGKWAENRSWATSYRGELWIHSSKLDTAAIAEQKADGVDRKAHSPTGLLTGHILGRVVLYDCVKRSDLLSVAPDWYLEEYRKQRPEMPPALARLQGHLGKVSQSTWRHLFDTKWTWVLANAEMLAEPIRAVGRLRLWTHQVETDRLVLAARRRKKWVAATPESDVALPTPVNLILPNP